VDDLEQPTLPPDDADIERLLRQYTPADAAPDTGTTREHAAEAWHDALDEALDDALERGLADDARR
jgi:hypothetical protein